MEPVARCVRAALDALGWNQAKASEVTGLSSPHMSQILNRKKPYGSRPPTPKTKDALLKIPTLSEYDLLNAIGQSTGLARPEGDPYIIEYSAPRRMAHNLIDKFPEDDLPRLCQMLVVMLN